MCTLIAIHRRVPGAFLAVAANRDEYFDRPAEGPALRNGPGGPFVAPRDCRAGGTWLGVCPGSRTDQDAGSTGRQDLRRRDDRKVGGARGAMFAAVTNRPCTEPDPNRRSRGMLVHDALAMASAQEAAELLSELPQDAYNPFNCFVADAERAFAVVYEGAPDLQELDPGVHVIGNADPNDRGVEKLARIMDGAEKASTAPRDRVLDELGSLCAEHPVGGNSLDDTCVHLEATYGTRSSALILLGEHRQDSRFLFADGPPCVTPYDDFTSLLHEQSQSASYCTEGVALRKAN